MVQVPTLTSVALAPAMVQTPVVSETKLTASDEVATADNGTTDGLNTCVPGLPKVMDWLAFDTVSVKPCDALGRLPLDTPKVSGNGPACVGVPDNTPVDVLNETPIGNVPVTE